MGFNSAFKGLNTFNKKKNYSLERKI